MRRGDGDHDTEGIRGWQIFAVDFDDPEANNWLAVNQFGVRVTVIRDARISCCSSAASPWASWNSRTRRMRTSPSGRPLTKLQTYKTELPTLFSFNGTVLVSDGVTARIGALTSGREWLKPWRTVTGEELAASTLSELQVMLQGVFDPRRFLALFRDFIVFEDDGSGKIVKKVAGYHQYHAVRVAVSEILHASISSGHLSNIISGKATRPRSF